LGPIIRYEQIKITRLADLILTWWTQQTIFCNDNQPSLMNHIRRASQCVACISKYL